MTDFYIFLRLWSVYTTRCWKVGEKSAVRNSSLCEGCFRCADACPTGAIIGYGTAYTVDELFDKVTQDELFFRNGNGGVTLSVRGCRLEIRYPLVVGYNDGEVGKIAGLLAGLKGVTGVKVLKYHNFAASRYSALGMPDTLPKALTTDADVERARKLFESNGIKALAD